MKTNYSYKVTLSYRGTNYSGWQNQKGENNTVQKYVEKVISQIANYKDFKVIAASRTDTGVHAHGQVLKIVIPKELSPNKLLLGMNSKLPTDIRVNHVQVVGKSFNVNKDVLSKEYHYYFCFHAPSAALNEIVYYHPNKLNLAHMKKACRLIIGEHNFAGLSVTGARNANPIRSIDHCSIIKANFSPFQEDVYYLKIKSTGFLKYMVRHIMGALIEVGEDNLSIEEIAKSLKTGMPPTKKKKAPARGLTLFNIKY